MNDSFDNPASTATPTRPPIGQLWQVPLLLLALVLLAAGWFVAAPEPVERDFGAEVAAIARQVERGEFKAAVEAVQALEAEGVTLPKAVAGQLDVVAGDAIAGLQRANGWDVASNHRMIVDRYRAAESRGQALATPQLVNLANSLIATDRVGEAEKLLDRFDADGQAERDKLRRRMIQMVVDRPNRSRDALKMLGEFVASDNLAREHRVWAVAQMGRVQLRSGPAEPAARLLSMWLQRLGYGEPGVKDLGELLVLLGNANLEMGERDAAERRYLEARDMLEPADPLHGEALVGLGRLRFADDNAVEAMEFFADAVSQYPDTRSYLPALVGKAECEARLGATGDALATLTEAVELTRDRKAARPDRFKLVADALASQREWRFDKGEFDVARQYLLLEERLHGDDAPPDLVLRLATTHEQIARQLLGVDGGALLSDRDAADRMRQADTATRAAVAANYRKAGDYYYAHAGSLTALDDDSFGESLWRSADCYDKAGRHNRAIEVFQEYAKSRGDEDPRRLNVIYRLAQAYQAEGQFEVAASKYRELVEVNPKSPEAYASLVPLARCYLSLGADRWALAEQVLLSVVTDHEALRPESREYREALTELGKLYYRRGGEGDFVRSIERLEEAVARYGRERVAPATLFQLGDAYRKSVGQIDERLKQPTPPSERARFQSQRAERLAAAQRCFDDVIRRYEAGNEQKLSNLDALYLRNAYFYRADCAYDLGRYTGDDGAIALYDRAVQRYEDQPAVLIALIQIVNSYCELGQYDKARTANERARWHLNRIPDEAFLDPDLPMDREHWQRWLDWTSELSLAERASADAGE